jgi:hypothetical protein
MPVIYPDRGGTQTIQNLGRYSRTLAHLSVVFLEALKLALCVISGS